MEFRYQYQGREYILQLELQSDGTYRALIDGRGYHIQILNAEKGYLDLRINDQRQQLYTASSRGEATGTQYNYVALAERWVSQYELMRVQETKTRRRSAGADNGSLTAQMPGQIVQVFFQAGDTVQKGQTILTLEAMKMELRLIAPYDGLIQQVFVKKGDTVERGQRLVDIHPTK
jgi:biotin carboxyl carrier protein